MVTMRLMRQSIIKTLDGDVVNGPCPCDATSKYCRVRRIAVSGLYGSRS